MFILWTFLLQVFYRKPNDKKKFGTFQVLHSGNMEDNSLSTDAVAEQEINDISNNSCTRPTVDWTFKHFLVTLADNVTDVELEKMKEIFSGDGGIARGVLSKVETPLQLFDLLQRRTWLSRDNLLCLQAALKTINRMDLVKIAAEYAQSIDNALYFYPASDQPENGYRFVRLHVCGLNVQNATCTRAVIQQIRLRFAELLFAPPECIIIAGIEPATSLILTLEVPESYVQLLIDILGTDADKCRFKDIDVDCIEIQHIEGLFQLSDTEEATPTVREQHKKLYNVYQQLENTKKQLEAYEIEQIQLNKRLEELQKEANKRGDLKTMVTSLDDSESPASGSVEKQVERHMLDKVFTVYLIDTIVRIKPNAVSEEYQLIEEKIKLTIKELEVNLHSLQFELLNLRDISIQETVYEKILRETTSVTKKIATIQEDEQLRQILKKISLDMRNPDRENLEEKYKWEPNDPLKQAMDNDRSFFLTGILYKKIKITNTFVEPGKFISHCLESVGRADLLHEFQSLLAATKADKTHKPSKRNEGNCVNLSKADVQIMVDQIDKLYEIIVSARYPTRRTPQRSRESADIGEFISHCFEAFGRTDLLSEIQSLVAAWKAKEEKNAEDTDVNLRKDIAV